LDLVRTMIGAASMIMVLWPLSNLQLAPILKLTVSFLSLVPCLIIYVWLGLIGPRGTAVKVRFPALHSNFQIEQD
jgi:hypothetical protein